MARRGVRWTPGVARRHDADTPPGWRHNPSALSERLPLVALALIGCAIATYLTLFQIGSVRQVWDPVFGAASSARVTNSAVAHALPIPDASLGALGYATEAVLGALGGTDRWRRRPWLVLSFGVVISGMGGAALLLLFAQGVVLRAWCLLCLCSAAISIVILCAGLGEPLAALQYLRKRDHDDFTTAESGAAPGQRWVSGTAARDRRPHARGLRGDGRDCALPDGYDPDAARPADPAH